MKLTKTNVILAAVILVLLLVGLSLRLAQPHTEVVVINGSHQRLANITVSVPGSEVSFRNLSPGDFVTTKVRRVVPTAGWSPSQHGRLADGVEIKSNGLHPGDGEPMARAVYIVERDGNVYASIQAGK